jgi:hypothetical protein
MGGPSSLLLVEGVCGVGKSTLVDALLRRYVTSQPARRLRTVLHLTQAHTYGPLAWREDAGTLTAADNATHLESVVSMLEWQVGAVAGAAVRKLVAVVDTLHLTHCRRPGVITWSEVAPFDRRLAALGARLLFMRASPATMWRRAVEGRRDSDFIAQYATRRFGPSLERIHRHLIAEQDAMEQDLARSAIDRQSLGADGALESYLEPAYDFWLD